MAAELICARRTKNFLEENGDQVLLCKENKKTGKEDKKCGNEPQTTIFNLLADKIGCIGMLGSLNVTVRVRQISNLDCTSI